MNPDDNLFPAPPTPSPDPMRAQPEKITATHNPYDFIVNPAAKTKKPVGVTGNPLVMRLLVIVGGALLIMFIIGFILNAVTGKKTNPAEFITLAQTQTEIARVADVGAGAGAAGIRNAAINTSLTLNTQQQASVKYLLAQGTKVATKQLTLKKSATTDQQLNTAAAANTFDLVYTQIMINQLQTYAATLKTTYQHTAGKNARAMLNTDYLQVQQLLAQWPAPSNLTD